MCWGLVNMVIELRTAQTAGNFFSLRAYTFSGIIPLQEANFKRQKVMRLDIKVSKLPKKAAFDSTSKPIKSLGLHEFKFVCLLRNIDMLRQR